MSETTNLIINDTTTAMEAKLSSLANEARELVAEGVPANTRRTYRSQWTSFSAWCRQHDQPLLPTTAETLVMYLTDRSREVKVSSLEVALAAITVAHREAGMNDWAATDLQGVRAFMRGLRRKKGQAPEKKEPLRLGDLQRGLPSGSTLELLQERAILLLGFFSAMRRSEITSLELGDLRKVPAGYKLTIWGSKTDKSGTGQVILVPELKEQPEVCPVKALKEWLTRRPETECEYVFLSFRTKLKLPDENVALMVKRAAERAGFDPKVFAGHSLRSGFATSAAESEAEERDIMRVTRHKSERTVREYIHEAELGAKHPGKRIARALK